VSGRAAGRHAPRQDDGNHDEGFLKKPQVDPDSPEGHKLGMSKRVQGAPSPIPGGKDHILNPPTFRQKPEAPSPADFTDQPDQNAHGVPPETHTGATRAQIMRGKIAAKRGDDQYYADPVPRPRPIPVVVVENQDDTSVYRAAVPRLLKASAGADPFPICGLDPDRVQVLLLNEDAANPVRFATTPADLVGGGGALLPANMSSYLRLPTQDHLYGYSDLGSAVTISVIQVFEHKGSGL
jgi:hypothetical protein